MTAITDLLIFFFIALPISAAQATQAAAAASAMPSVSHSHDNSLIQFIDPPAFFIFGRMRAAHQAIFPVGVQHFPANAFLLFVQCKRIRLRHPFKKLVIQIGGIADHEVRCPAARIGFCFYSRADGGQRLGKAQRKDKKPFRQVCFLLCPQEGDAGEKMAVVERDLRLHCGFWKERDINSS